MDEYLEQGLAMARAQAGVRAMTVEEIMKFAQEFANGLRGLEFGGSQAQAARMADGVSGRGSIKQKTLTCLECGKKMKLITKAHLATHGLTPAEYKEKWGIKRDTPLMAKELVRQRRQKMQDMRLWERPGSRGNKAREAAADKGGKAARPRAARKAAEDK